METMPNEAVTAPQTVKLNSGAYSSVRNLKGEFVPTVAMIGFRDALFEQGFPRRCISRTLRAAGLSDNTYWVWVQRYKQVFLDWLFDSWELNKHILEMRLEAIGEAKMENDFRYWNKMLNVLK